MSHQPNAPPAYDDAQKYAAYPDPNAPDHGGAHQYQPNMSNPQHPPPGAPGNAGANTTTYLYVAEGGQTQLGPRPQNQVLTKVKYSAGLLTWLLFGGCLLFGCWLGCCLIPFCMDDCQDCEHYCTNCKAFMGQYKRI